MGKSRNFAEGGKQCGNALDVADDVFYFNAEVAEVTEVNCHKVHKEHKG